MAPELLSGKKGNSSIDVYSFGMLAFELFTCTVPYEGSTAQQTTTSIVKGERRVLSCGACPRHACGTPGVCEEPRGVRSAAHPPRKQFVIGGS